MGGKTSQTQQVQSIPPDVLARYNAVNAQAEQVAATPFQQYSSDPSAFVAPLNPVQMGAIQNTQEYANLAQPYYNLGTGLTLAGAGAANPDQLDIGQYMSPYLGSVVGSTLANLQQQQQQDTSALNGTAIGAGAFGGDRSGIAQANLARQQELATGQTVSGILNQGYGQALSTAQQQQGVNLGAQQANLARLAQAGQGIAGLGAGAQQAGISGAQAQLAAGTATQQTQQAGLSALYNQFLQQQGYPFQTTQFLANIAEGTGALSGGTTTSTQPSSFFSDERLKENIETIGHTHDGMKIIKFNYKGHPEKQIGFSAQDVEKHHPEAVGESQGYKTVDYDKATQQSAHLGHHKDSMGGSVHEGHAGEGYANGGLTTDDIIKQIMLASQKTMPYGGIGLYGNPNFNRSGAYDTSQADLQMGFRKGPPGPAGLRPSDYVAPVAFASGGVVPHMADGGIPDYLTIMQQAYGNSPWAKAIGAGGGGLGIPTQAPAARYLPNPSALPAQRKSGLQETAGLGMQGLEGYKTYTDIQKNLADADKEKGTMSDAEIPPHKPENPMLESGVGGSNVSNIEDINSNPFATNAMEDNLGSFDLYRGGLVRHHYDAGGLPYNTDDPYVPAEDTEQKPPQKLQNPQEIAKKAAGNPIMGGLGGAALTAALTSNPWLIGAAGLMGTLSQSKRGGLITGHPHYAEGGLAPREHHADGDAVGDATDGDAVGDATDDWEPYFAQAEKDTGVPAGVLKAVAQQESNFGRADPQNPMQITKGTARDPGYGLSPLAEEDLSAPEKFIPWSSQYIAARNPNVDWNDPTAAAQALAKTWNGGGDPNYAYNVARYLPGMSEQDPITRALQIAQTDLNAPEQRIAAQEAARRNAAQAGLKPPSPFTSDNKNSIVAGVGPTVAQQAAPFAAAKPDYTGWESPQDRLPDRGLAAGHLQGNQPEDEYRPNYVPPPGPDYTLGNIYVNPPAAIDNYHFPDEEADGEADKGADLSASSSASSSDNGKNVPPKVDSDSEKRKTQGDTGGFWNTIGGILGDVGGTLTSEKFLVPALSGLAGMAASPSRYLGSAILSGLGSGASAYENILNRQPIREKQDLDNQQSLLNQWIGYNALTGDSLPLQDYAKSVNYTGKIPTPPAQLAVASGVPPEKATPSHTYTLNEFSQNSPTSSFTSPDGKTHQVNAMNDPEYLSNFIAKNAAAAAVNPTVSAAVQNAQNKLNAIRNSNQVIDTAGNPQIWSSGIDVTRQAAEVNGAIVRGQEHINEAQKFYPQAAQQDYNLDRLTKIYQDYAGGRGAGLTADISGFLNSVGISNDQINKIIKDKNGDTNTTGAYDEAMKIIANQIIQQTAQMGTKAPLAEMNAIRQAVANPPQDPTARRHLIAQMKGLINYQKDYYGNFNAGTDDFDQYAKSFSQTHLMKNYVDAADKEILQGGAFAGEQFPKLPQKTEDRQKEQIYTSFDGKKLAQWDGKNLVPVPVGRVQ